MLRGVLRRPAYCSSLVFCAPNFGSVSQDYLPILSGRLLHILRIFFFFLDFFFFSVCVGFLLEGNLRLIIRLAQTSLVFVQSRGCFVGVHLNCAYRLLARELTVRGAFQESFGTSAT